MNDAFAASVIATCSFSMPSTPISAGDAEQRRVAGGAGIGPDLAERSQQRGVRFFHLSELALRSLFGVFSKAGRFDVSGPAVDV